MQPHCEFELHIEPFVLTGGQWGKEDKSDQSRLHNCYIIRKHSVRVVKHFCPVSSAFQHLPLYSGAELYAVKILGVHFTPKEPEWTDPRAPQELKQQRGL